MLEVDMVLGRFLKAVFWKCSESEQQAFIALADYDDMALWRLISGRDECEDARLTPVVAMLRECKP
jgi:succinate dehydrogenase flavin-adding protein (antitoxin of CptAB toxin-antitoxin module)